VSTRIQDAGEIERRLLELAHTTDAKLTAAALAYFAPCSLDDAARVLEGLAARDRLTMDVEDDGTIVYQLPGRQKLAPVARALRPALIRRPAARAASPLAAMALGLFVPGLGHLYAGRAFSALLWFVVVSMGYVLLLPGLVLHLFSLASAARAARRLDEPRRPLQLVAQSER
jgi:hypothetical protein